MKNIRSIAKAFFGGILAGICIGIGGTVYLSVENRIAGALLFATGLYSICAHGLYLYTGKIGYLPFESSGEYVGTLALTLTGNYVGTSVMAAMINKTRIDLQARAADLCAAKLNDSYENLIVLGIFCGILMFIAVDGYKRTGNPLILFACIAAFILCGFEHCVADMFYFSLAQDASLYSFLATMAVAFGNSIGAWLIPMWRKYAADD